MSERHGDVKAGRETLMAVDVSIDGAPTLPGASGKFTTHTPASPPLAYGLNAGVGCGNTRAYINSQTQTVAQADATLSWSFGVNDDYDMDLTGGGVTTYQVSAGETISVYMEYHGNGGQDQGNPTIRISWTGHSKTYNRFGVAIDFRKPTPQPSDHTSRLMYDANGGSGAPQGQSKTVSDTSDTGEIDFTVSYTKPTWSGHTFLGWSEDEYATDASYSGGDSIGVPYDSSTTLYAVWKENPKPTARAVLAYDANGGSGAPVVFAFSVSACSFGRADCSRGWVLVVVPVRWCLVRVVRLRTRA